MSLSQKNIQINQVNERKAHFNIELKHANSDMMSCTTCHQKNKSYELKTLENKAVKMNHSYLVCAQCHSSQAKDWSGGAHGKRLVNWAGKRIVKNCTSCHNPHQPKLKKRWPKTNVYLPGEK